MTTFVNLFAVLVLLVLLLCAAALVVDTACEGRANPDQGNARRREGSPGPRPSLRVRGRHQ